MTDTPRSDAAAHNMGSVAKPHYVVDVDFARQLEREITRLKGEAESWEKVFDRTCEHLAEAKSELAEAIAKERERCALVCERKIIEPTGTYQIVRYQILMAAAKEIRKGE